VPDLVLEYHRLKTPIDHPLRSVTREHLEYPTEDVTLIYLAAINKVATHRGGGPRPSGRGVYTSDAFTDKAVEGNVKAYHEQGWWGRYIDNQNWYENYISVDYSSADHKIQKIVNGSVTALATESVDLSGYTHPLKLSISGSTIKSFRDGASSPQISATDTALASGGFGGFGADSDHNDEFDFFGGKLIAPASSLPQPLIIVEMEVTGRGLLSDPYRPSLLSEPIPIDRVDNVPEFLKEEYKRYQYLRAKGLSRDEMCLLFRFCPQIEIDAMSITWGAFEFHPEKSSTVVIAVYGDNPYRSGAIEKQASRAIRKMRAPRDYREAVETYKTLRKDHGYWLAGKDNFAYQVLGHGDLELFAVADFYFGELVEHRTHYHQLKRVPDWEMRRTLERWVKRLEKVTILTEERDKHLNKLRKVMKLGW